MKVSFDKSKVALSADGESGLVSWVSVPQDIELPEESQLVYEIICQDSNYNWHFIGNCIITSDIFDTFLNKIPEANKIWKDMR